MAGREILYGINALIKYTDIDVFTALKNAGSRAAYFEKLENFSVTVPDMISTFESQASSNDPARYLKTVHRVQDKLLDIGATDYVWDAEMVAELAKTGENEKRTAETAAFAEKLRALLSKIENSKLSSPEGDFQQQGGGYSGGSRRTGSADDRRKRVMDEISPEADKPQAFLESGTFERIRFLIENFETDEAAEMLVPQLGYTFTPEIDLLLETVYRSLTDFDHDKAIEDISRVINILKATEKSGADGERKKILAIDDMPEILGTVKSVLRGQYTIYCVTNHKAALRFLTSNKADLILLDIEMPDMDGFTLLNIIRRIHDCASTPILFLTGNVSVENVKKSYFAGANDFIRKPIEPQMLLTRIEKHLSV